MAILLSYLGLTPYLSILFDRAGGNIDYFQGVVAEYLRLRPADFA
jgi:hypothetical protein